MTLIYEAVCALEHSAVAEIEVWEVTYEGKIFNHVSFAARGIEIFPHLMV